MTTKSVPRTKREPKADEGLTPVPVPEDKLPSMFETFMDHQRKAFDESGQAIESLLPVAFKEHSKTALKETVEAYRQLVNSVLDEVVDRIEKLRVPGEKVEKEEVHI